MRCPHCTVEFHDEPNDIYIGKDIDGAWGISFRLCPKCNRHCLELVRGDFYVPTERGSSIGGRQVNARLIYPKASSRTPVPKQVPVDFSEDYLEACLVLPDSVKASAALSRRCLQHLLRKKAAVKQQDLAKEIQEVLDRRELPTHLAEGLDAVRVIGNFAAHPIKAQSTGEIVPVEQGEAEWTLDVIEALFDFYFVQPDIINQKRDALNKKLASAGKPPLK